MKFFFVQVSAKRLLGLMVYALFSALLYSVFFIHMTDDVSKKYNKIEFVDRSEFINKDFKIEHKVLRLREKRSIDMAIRMSLVRFDDAALIYIDINSEAYKKLAAILHWEKRKWMPTKI